jgi:Family of unknown function (DUF5670)
MQMFSGLSSRTQQLLTMSLVLGATAGRHPVLALRQTRLWARPASITSARCRPTCACTSGAVITQLRQNILHSSEFPGQQARHCRVHAACRSSNRRHGRSVSISQYASDLRQRRNTVLYTIAVVLIVLWLLGLITSYTMGGVIHVLLVIAIVMILIQVIQGRRL